jgi:ketosteroid isomerase-like protein
MSDEQRNLQVVAEVGRCWNEGDYDGTLAYYHDDIVMKAAPNWPVPGPWVGKDAVAENQRDWASAWERIEMSVERIEAKDDKVVLLGRWHSRGVMSGAAGETPLVMVFTLEDGLVKHFDFSQEADDALRAAGIA